MTPWLRLSLLGVLPALHASAAMTAHDVYDQLLQAQQRQVFLSCDLVREEVRGGGVSQTASGTLEVAPGGKAKLEILRPSRQIAVSDGHTLWVEMSDVKQVMKYNAAQLRQSGNFFLDLGSSIQHYAKASLKRLIVPGPGFDASKTSALELTPLDPASAGFDSMRVWVDRDHWLVRQVELQVDGVDTRVRFENIRVINKGKEDQEAETPSTEIFQYHAPQGYQVFDMGSMQQ